MTDALTAANGLATILGLVNNFTASRGNAGVHKDVLEIQDFTAWLRFHGHEELINFLERNLGATASLKAMFAEGRTALDSRLANIERLLGLLAQDQGAIYSLALSVGTASPFSAQGGAILVAFENACAGKAQVDTSMDTGAVTLLFIDGSRSATSFTSTEPRFLDADLDELAALGLLKRTALNGRPGVQITRKGSDVARALIEASSERPAAR